MKIFYSLTGKQKIRELPLDNHEENKIKIVESIDPKIN